MMLDEDMPDAPWMRPYAEEKEGGDGASPFADATGMHTGAGGGEAAVAKLGQLPPKFQVAIVLALGADPMLASAWLQVLGPQYGPLVQAAIQAAGPIKQQFMAQQQGGMQTGMGAQPGMGGGAPPMRGGGAPAPQRPTPVGG